MIFCLFRHRMGIQQKYVSSCLDNGGLQQTHLLRVFIYHTQLLLAQKFQLRKQAVANSPYRRMLK